MGLGRNNATLGMLAAANSTVARHNGVDFGIGHVLKKVLILIGMSDVQGNMIDAELMRSYLCLRPLQMCDV